MAKKVEVVKENNWCCWGGSQKGFPSFAVIILVLGLFWLLNELGVITTGVPWFPIILVVIALGWIIDHYRKK